jgi:hypothetical protein
MSTFRITVAGGTILRIGFIEEFALLLGLLSVYHSIYGKSARAADNHMPWVWQANCLVSRI